MDRSSEEPVPRVLRRGDVVYEETAQNREHPDGKFDEMYESGLWRRATVAGRRLALDLDAARAEALDYFASLCDDQSDGLSRR